MVRATFLYSLLMSFTVEVIAVMYGFGIDLFLCFLLVFADSFLLAGLAWLLDKIRMGWVVMAGLVALTVSELFTVFFYHSLFTLYVIQLITETTPQESSEFLSAAVTSSAMWQTLLVTLAVLGVCAVLVRQRFWTNRWVRYVLCALIAWSCIRQVSCYWRLGRALASATVQECIDMRERLHLNTPCVRLLFGLAFNRATTSELDTLVETVERTQVDSCTHESPLIVLIIGESYNKHHSSLYHPDYLPTCPKLQVWKERGNLVLYDDAVTPFNLTSHVFKNMFSTWDDECADYWTSHTLFPAVFRKAGYAVHFVTNQFVNTSNDDNNALGGTIFNHSRLSDLQFTSRNKQAYAYDAELLRDIPSHSIVTSVPTLLIVHLYGQHVSYESRYPKEYECFTAADERTPFGGEEGRRIAAQYDNAVLYNDAVVDSVLRKYADDDAVCIYLADHGEEAYDWRDCYERTNEAVLTQGVARYQYEVPFMFFMTDTFQTRHAELALRIRQHTQRRFLSTDLSNVLFHLAGISSPDYKADKDILSDSYNTLRRRLIRQDTDYDALK